MAKLKKAAKSGHGRTLGVLALLLICLSFGLGGYSIYHWVWGAETHLRAARQALEQGDFAQAEAQLTLYLAARPQSAEAHLLAAQAVRRAVEPTFPGARDAFEPSPPVGAADAHVKFERHLRDYQRLGGSAPLAHLEQYLFRAQCGDLAEVEGDLQALVRQDSPFAALILEALAKGYLLTYRLEHAETCLSRKLERREDAPTLVWRGRVRKALGSTVKALADYRRAVELAPEHEPVRLCLAETLVGAAQAEEAVGHFEFLRQRQPGNPAVGVGLARCRSALDEAAQARRLLDELLAQHPRHLTALIERGKLALSEGQAAEAEVWLQRAVALAPGDYQANYVLAMCLQQCGRTEESCACLAKLTRIRADLKRLDEVTRRVMQAPRDPDPRSEAGRIFLRNGYAAEGLRWLESVLELDPRHGPTHQALAEHYQQAGDPERAGRHRRLALPAPD